MTLPDILILALFSWRAAYLLVKEDGPFSFMARIRAVTTFGGLLTCLYCASVWTAALGYVLLHTTLAPLVMISAASGLALLAHRYTGGDHV